MALIRRSNEFTIRKHRFKFSFLLFRKLEICCWLKCRNILKLGDKIDNISWSLLKFWLCVWMIILQIFKKILNSFYISSQINLVMLVFIHSFSKHIEIFLKNSNFLCVVFHLNTYSLQKLVRSEVGWFMSRVLLLFNFSFDGRMKCFHHLIFVNDSS